MLIWLVDFDGKTENLALMRLSAWHKAQGDTVRLKRGAAYPELFEMPDKVYISCIFRWHKEGALHLAESWGDRAEIGGTGVDITKTLLPEVAATPPDYDLYGESRAFGFISRGCIRKCPWCIVPAKEGRLERVTTAREIVGSRREALLMDNNFLAMPGYMDDLLWLAKNRVKVDFNQGLDASLIDDETAYLLYACRSLAGGGVKVRIALDSEASMPVIGRAVDTLLDAGILSTQIFVYCLIGHDGFDSDVKRLLYLHSLNVRVYPMGYRDINTGIEPKRGWNPRFYQQCKRAIIKWPFAKLTWDEFIRGVGEQGAPRI